MKAPRAGEELDELLSLAPITVSFWVTALIMVGGLAMRLWRLRPGAAAAGRNKDAIDAAFKETGKADDAPPARKED